MQAIGVAAARERAVATAERVCACVMGVRARERNSTLRERERYGTHGADRVVDACSPPSRSGLTQ